MKKYTWKKVLSVTLGLSMMASMLSACGSSNEAGDTKEAATTESSIVDFQEGEILGSKLSEVEGEGKADVNASVNLHISSAGTKMGPDQQTTIDGISFLMIYNPQIYEECDDTLGIEVKNGLYTGDFSDQIITMDNRAGGLEEGLEMPVLLSQGQLSEGSLGVGESNREDGRAGGMDPVYSKGDKHTFYRYDSNVENRYEEEFTCVYAGEHSYIWSTGDSISEAEAANVGNEFDTVIYNQDVDEFGNARFTENGGKVNLLYYPMCDGLCGFFTMKDIFASTEVTADYITSYGLNTDHAIISINSNMLSKPKEAYATMAHEFQHLICASEYFYYNSTPIMETWLNEAMSAYAEDMIYPGSKEETYYNQMYYLSDNFRKGQSLYNFSTQNIDDPSVQDESLGSYGAVYLYSLYLEQLAGGKDVFTNIHKYWRDSYSAYASEEEALISALPAYAVQQINDAYSYPDSVKANFKTAEEMWMSKLTLDFYLETFYTDLCRLPGHEDSIRGAMLYTQLGGYSIEGGGKMVVALKNGSYTIPADADDGLVYIGFDKDFNIVTELIAK